MNAMPTRGFDPNQPKRISSKPSRARPVRKNAKIPAAGEGSVERTDAMNMMSKIAAAPIVLDETNLPSHVATAAEPIPPLDDCSWAGPDMQQAPSIEEMLIELTALDDCELDYLAHWLHLMKSVGGWVNVNIEKDSTRHLSVGMPCDGQTRHRSRWTYFLAKDLRRLEERESALMELLIAFGRFHDQRPAGIRETMDTLRAFLAAGFRVFITPKGEIEESGSMPREWAEADRPRQIEIESAGRAFLKMHHRPRARKYIRRAIRMLGERRDSGFIVLRGRGDVA